MMTTESDQPAPGRPTRVTLSRSGWAVVIGGLLVSLSVIAASALMLWRERENAVEEWKASLSQISILLAEHTRQAVTAADLVLKSISDRVNEAGIESDDELRREMGTREIFELLRNRVGNVPQVDVATIVAANGDVINFTRSYPPPPINLADRDYFKAHLSDPGLDVILSVPVKNRGTGTWTFYLARKIKSRSGKTLGVVLTGIESKFFEEFFQAVNIGEASAISLFRADGVLLARFPERQSLIGTSFRDQAVFRDIIGSGKISGAVVTSSPRLADSWLNQLRIVAPRRIGGYPLVINITATEELIFDAWSGTAVFIAGGAALFVLLLLGMTAWIATLLTRREHTMRELRRARLTAEEAARAKAEFLAMMSHEIRTPMNAVIGTSSLLAASELAPAQRRFVRIIEDSASHLLTIINDILDFSRLEAGRFDIEKSAFSPRELADGIVALAHTLPGADRIDIATALAGNLPDILVGDAGRLKQVLLNLMSNAVKYTDRGVITLSAAIVDKSDSTIRVRFAVTDTGTGIAPEMHARLFQPFEQGDSRLARRKGGTGLGLAISKRIVDLMGGQGGLREQAGTRVHVLVRGAPEQGPRGHASAVRGTGECPGGRAQLAGAGCRGHGSKPGRCAGSPREARPHRRGRGGWRPRCAGGAGLPLRRHPHGRPDADARWVRRNAPHPGGSGTFAAGANCRPDGLRPARRPGSGAHGRDERLPEQAHPPVRPRGDHRPRGAAHECRDGRIAGQPRHGRASRDAGVGR
jgi:signal transduction histidine kinase